MPNLIRDNFSPIHNESTEIQSSPLKRRLRSASSTPETAVTVPQINGNRPVNRSVVPLTERKMAFVMHLDSRRLNLPIKVWPIVLPNGPNGTLKILGKWVL